ncbi:MAG: hypothetical protein SNJ64_01370, partial [Endomicrobiia bacterium]
TFTNITSPEKECVNIIKKAIKILFVHNENSAPQKYVDYTIFESQSVIPDFSKRSIFIKEDMGFPILYYSSNNRIISVDTKNQNVAVYVDVSDSMNLYYEALYSALAPFVKRKIIRIFLWSTEVKEIEVSDFINCKIYSTFGTDATCVLEHVLENNFKKFLIITDGEFEKPDNKIISELKTKNFVANAILTPDCDNRIIKLFVKKIFYFPKLVLV